MGWAGKDTYIQKGVTERFGFDISESRKFKIPVKNKATGTPLGMLYTYHGKSVGIVISLDLVPFRYVIIQSSWGFQRCSFRQEGQCESLEMWNGQQYRAPRFFVHVCRVKRIQYL